MKRRMLLLGVAVASLGALLVTGAISNPSGTASTGGSALVSVQGLVGLTAAFANQETEIIANGTAQKVADILAGEDDPDYFIEAQSLALDQTGVSTFGTCTGISATPYSLTANTTPTGDLTPDSAVANVDVGDLSLTMPVTVNSDCQVSGAVVDVTFQAVAVGTD